MILYYKIGIKIVIKIFLFISKCIRFGITIKINTIETRGIYSSKFQKNVLEVEGESENIYPKTIYEQEKIVIVGFKFGWCVDSRNYRLSRKSKLSSIHITLNIL